MKKIIFILILLVGIVQACNKKAIPTIADRTTDPPKPESPVANVKPDIEAGKTIFTTRCDKCHDLPDPVKYTAERWDGILQTMIPRAGISRVQEVHLTAYIKANSAK